MAGTQSCAQVTFGALRRQVDAGDFLLTESDYAPGLRTEAHAHSVTSLVFGLIGGLEQTHGSCSGALAPRTLLVLPRNVIHTDQVGREGCSCLFVSLGPDKLESIQRYTPVLESIRFAGGGRIGFIASALHHESWAQDSVRGLAVEGLVYDLLASLARERGPRDEHTAPWLLNLRDRLEVEFARPLALTDLARDAGVHPAYLARAFARKFGISLSVFVRTRRIEWAMDRLRQSRDPVAEIAVAAGFFDQSHFTRVFKRTVGTTPARFRHDHGWSTGR
jgi:AraC family transcriptional regulator